MNTCVCVCVCVFVRVYTSGVGQREKTWRGVVAVSPVSSGRFRSICLARAPHALAWGGAGGPSSGSRQAAFAANQPSASNTASLPGARQLPNQLAPHTAGRRRAARAHMHVLRPAHKQAGTHKRTQARTRT